MKYIAIIILLITVSSCSRYKYVSTGNARHDRIPKDYVTLYIDKAKIPANYKEMGLIFCKSNKEHKAIKHARKLAAKNGADGIYILSEKDITGWQGASNFLLGANYKNKMRVIAFRTF